MTASTRYVLVTPAMNEEALIGATIESVVNQTCLPAEWVIVSDGSTDRTEDIVKAASATHPWIRLLSLPPRAHRSFAAVVHATETGIRALAARDYAYLGLLDSDLRFQPDYFERVLSYFEASPRLGLAGGVVIDVGLCKDHVPRNLQDVPGAVQFFRRTCFEALGGLIAIPEGGWDALTCARARMTGFETRLLTDLVVDHLKPRNVSEGGLLRRHWQMGVRDYAAGYHALFEVVKCASRLSDPPWLIGSIAWWTGYCSAVLKRRERVIPDDLLAFVQGEQKRRLRQMLNLPSGSARRRSMIILNFHGVGPVLRAIDDGERACWLEQDNFETLLDLVRGQSHVALTVDDGNASDIEIVLPALLRRGLTATFFVCSGRLGQPTFLGPDHVCELKQRGMRIGSHGVAHIPWRHLSDDQLADELGSSRQVFERICGAPVDSAACPFGAYDRAVLSGLRRAGYQHVYTSDGGAAAEGGWLLARTTVTRSTSLDDVGRLVQEGPGPWKQASIGLRTFIKRMR